VSPRTWIEVGYIAASLLFIFGLKRLSRIDTARQGNALSALGMLLAVLVTLAEKGLAWPWIVGGAAVGAAVGAWMARTVKMTGMPEMVALFNGVGGLASLLVGWAGYLNPDFGDRVAPPLLEDRAVVLIPIYLAVLIGGVTFTGSLVAWLKLSERVGGQPVVFPGQRAVNGLVAAGLIAGGFWLTLQPDAYWHPGLLIGIVLSFALGVLLVIPIGGADMPVVISLLNSYSGLAACAAGFAIGNDVLIVAGALVGASGLILTRIMCKAMNRSLANVLFSGFASTGASVQGAEYRGEAKPISAEDCQLLLEAAKSVVVVPGYGMAVAQAQHVVKELAEQLERNGAEVVFAIHPVAGRMPGHMNVLLAEADVSYDKLVEPQDVNPRMGAVDVALVIGANDVVNPAARSDPGSPLYGMPILNVDEATTCIVLKRSLKPGFAGVENPLFLAPRTRMLLGDAKSSLQALVAEFKAG
jgi:NAD(P) transhydrogenase subunit beta